MASDHDDRDSLRRDLRDLTEADIHAIFPRPKLFPHIKGPYWKRLIAPIATFATAVTLAGILIAKQLSGPSLEERIHRYPRLEEIQKSKSAVGIYSPHDLGETYKEIAKYDPELTDIFAKGILTAENSDFAKVLTFAAMYRATDSPKREELVGSINDALRSGLQGDTSIRDLYRTVFPDDKKDELTARVSPDNMRLLGTKMIGWERYCTEGYIKDRTSHVLRWLSDNHKRVREQYDRQYQQEHPAALLEDMGNGQKFLFLNMDQRRRERNWERPGYSEENQIYAREHERIQEMIQKETSDAYAALQKKLAAISELTGAPVR